MQHVLSAQAVRATSADGSIVIESVKLHVSKTEAVKVLEVGCGHGARLLEIGRLLPNAVLHGVDASEIEVERAIARASGQGFATRAHFRSLDYMAYNDGPFYVIVCEEALQVFDVSTDALMQKLASDLAPGGLLMLTLPLAGGYNRILWALDRARRLLTRGPCLARRGERPNCSRHVDSPRKRAQLRDRYGLRLVQWQGLDAGRVTGQRRALVVYRKTSPDQVVASSGPS